VGDRPEGIPIIKSISFYPALAFSIPAGDTMKKHNFEDIESKVVGEGCKGVNIRWLITKDMGAERFAMRMFELEPVRS
jgi:hypothetical protein